MKPSLEAGAPRVSDDNPMGTDGFEFVEFAHPEPAALAALFEQMGFVAVARHRSKDVTLYRQGDVNYVLNAEPDSFAAAFARAHGPSACAMGFRVKDAAFAFGRALDMGATAAQTKIGPMELNIPAIVGVGGALVYLVDRYGETGSIFDVDFRWTATRDPHPQGVGLTTLDHLTHNVYRGHMDEWAGWVRALLRFPADSLFRHRGQAHRPAFASHDQPLREDTHSHQ